MENMLELQSVTDIMNVFTDKVHCNLTINDLVKVTKEMANQATLHLAEIVVPANLVLDIFNALIIDGGQKYDGIGFEYNSQNNIEHEIWIAHNGCLHNDFYNTERDCQCVLSVNPLYNDNINDYMALDDSFILFHPNCSNELLNLLTPTSKANHIVVFDLIEE